jgi:hypothetical protein
MRKVLGFACVAVAALALAASQDAGPARGAQGGDKKEYSISDVMKQAHAEKGALVKKAINGTATDAEAKLLVAMYESLKAATPPAGSKESWQTKCDALLSGAKLYVDGKKDEAKTQLQKASNCMACHKVHKG